MIRELALVWLSSAATLQAHRGEIDGWAKAQNAQLRAPMPPVPLAYNAAIAENIELQLERARTAQVLEQAESMELIAQLREQILAHPELPQSAWLLAECHRLGAEAFARASNAVEAAERLNASIALEGARAEVYDAEPYAITSIALTAKVEIELQGTRAEDEIYLDGVRSPLHGLSTPGPHHVRVIRGFSVLWSGWLDVAPQGGILRVPLNVASCSANDFWGTRMEQNQLRVPTGVSCNDWVAARPASNNTGVEVAWCHASSCESFVSWPVRTVKSKPNESSATAWYVWPLVGAGVALGTAAVLWQTGAFDSASPAARSFTFTGPIAPASANTPTGIVQF